MNLPSNIENLFYQAKEKYPELKDTSVKLKYTPLSYATMRTLPSIFSLFFCFKKAKYKISINANKTFKKFSIPIDCLSESIILGWFGHEIAHILQYEKMSYFERVFFVFKYVFNKKFRKNFETKADEITKERGLEKELKEGINFTLTDPRVSNAYKKRTREFYSQI